MGTESGAMKPQALNDWQELSALYEQADALEPADLAEWIGRLRAQRHPLLPQLEQMLAARDAVQRNGFLDAPPALPIPDLRAPTHAQAEAEPLQAWEPGSRVGPYRLVRTLGAGGMAEVWLAERDDGAFQRRVAIKLLFRHAGTRDGFAQRFARERDILASLNHPHIAALHDAGVMPGGQPWLALEYVEGQPLTTWCDAKRLGVEARVRLFRQVLLAVQHAHANLVIHRDLKPGNILVTLQGEVRLLDFGIAKLMEPETGALVETELTRMAGQPLTVAYASPEQLLGQPLSTASDVYSLGVVLYELLCGERPYALKAQTAAQLEQAILDIDPRAPSRRALTPQLAQWRSTTVPALRKVLANDLDAIVLRALGKRPSQRYGSVDALRADIDRWLDGEPVQARTPSPWYQASKFIGRHPVGVSLGSLAVLALVATAAIALWLGVQAREESSRAIAARDFMLGIFQRADQEKAQGTRVTARELLETGRKDVLVRLAGQPRLQAELLQGIGKIQHDMGEHGDADGTYAELVRLYQLLGSPVQAVGALADQADNAMYQGDYPRAERLLREGRRLAAEAGVPAVSNARLDEVAGWVELGQGSPARAHALFTSAREAYRVGYGEGDSRTFAAARALARSDRALLRFDDAIGEYRAMQRNVARSPGLLEAAERAEFDWEFVDLLHAAGRYAQALEAAGASIPACLAARGAGDANCLLLGLKNAQTLARLGRVEAARAELPGLAPLLEDKVSPLARVEAQILMARVGAAPEAMRATLGSLAESGREMAVPATFKAAAAFVLAEAALRAGTPAVAVRWLDTADRQLAGPRESSGTTLARGLSAGLRGMTLMQGAIGPMRSAGAANAANAAGGASVAERALGVLREARAAVGRTLGERHPQALLMSLNEAVALERLGRRADALALADAALPTLRTAFGPQAPTLDRAEALQQRLHQAGPPPADPEFFH